MSMLCCFTLTTHFNFRLLHISIWSPGIWVIWFSAWLISVQVTTSYKNIWNIRTIKTSATILWTENHTGPSLRYYGMSSGRSVSWRYAIILYFNLHLGLPSDLGPSDFLAKILYAFFTFLISSACRTYLELITEIIFSKAFKLWSYSSWYFLHPFC
jgi:hypothetical protein